MMKRLEKSNIKYYDSDANFFLIESSSNRDVIMSQLEEDQIIMYNSMEGHDNYWTLPTEMKKQMIEFYKYYYMII